MLLHELKNTPLHLLPIAAGAKTRFSALFQFKGYLTGQYGAKVKHQSEGGKTYYISKDKVIAKWDGLTDTGFVVPKAVSEGDVIQGNFKQHGKVLVSYRRDAGDEWKYWNGVNWFNPKSRAVEVPVDKVEKLISAWGMDRLGTETRVQSINEEALETKNIEDLWDDNKDAAAFYVNSTQYMVRAVKGSSPTEYEAYSVDGDKRKLFGKFTATELKATLAPIRPNQTPDAEGYTTYVDPTRVEAVKYNGDAVKVLINKEGQRLNNGDYIIRTNDGNNFEYAIERPSEFSSTLVKSA